MWNVACGGFAPPSPKGRKLSKESIEKGVTTRKRLYAELSQEDKDSRHAYKRGVKLSPEWVAKLSLAASNRRPWKSSKAKLENWTRASEFLDTWVQNNKCGWAKLSKIVGISKHSCQSFVEHFRAGWNPSEDPEYLAWRESYLAEQEKETNGTYIT